MDNTEFSTVKCRIQFRTQNTEYNIENERVILQNLYRIQDYTAQKAV